MLELLDYTFFQYAIIGSILSSVICGIIGTYIVTKRLVFISGGITHASLGGIGIGLYSGVSPIFAASIFSILSAIGIEWLSERRNVREDSAIAMFWTFGMSIGIIFSYMTPGYVPDLTTYLFGNIMTIELYDLYYMLILTIIICIFYIIFRNTIICMAFDEIFARSSKLPITLLKYIMIVFISLSVVACIRISGIVLTLSMMTVPIMTASIYTKRYNTTIFLSILFGTISCLGGIVGAYYINIPSGTSIIFFSICIYAISKITMYLKSKSINR